MYGNLNNVHIETFGERTSVPDDDVAKLMYYLSCVDTVINYNEIDNLTDYENYDLLTLEEMTLLFKLVLLFNPEIFISAGIFILDENLLTYGMDNQFYQITDERIGIHVENEIMLGGRSVKVSKVMACNESWLIRNYYRPWKNIFELTEKYQRYSSPFYVPPPPDPIYTPPKRDYYRQTSNYKPPQQPIYNPPRTNYNSYTSNTTLPQVVVVRDKKEKDGCGCSCLIF